MPEYLQISHPGSIPFSATIGPSLKVKLRNDCMQLLSSSDSWSCNEKGTERLDAVLNGSIFQKVEVAFTRSTQDDKTHDEYFHIIRVDGNHSEIFVKMIVQTYALFLKDAGETPFTLGPGKMQLLDEAFIGLLSWAMATDNEPVRSRVSTWRTRSSALEAPSGARNRWIRGHQIFAAITQGLIAAFRDLRQALANSDGKRVAKSVDLAVLLLRGSGVALEFTGDFSSDDYNDIIRPSMTPPLVPDTFSGLLSSDHRYLVHLLKEMKPLMDTLHEHNAEHHGRIAQALREVYDSHKFVCNRLVGKMPSLMMATGSKKSGADQIEKFKALRMKVFEPKAQATS